jgi:hypothetical protein
MHTKKHLSFSALVGDSLYSKQPFMEELAAEGMTYVLVVKEEDHKLLMEWVNEQRQLKEVSRLEVKDKKHRLHIYEWINGVPLNGNNNTLWANYFEYWLVAGGGSRIITVESRIL